MKNSFFFKTFCLLLLFFSCKPNLEDNFHTTETKETQLHSSVKNNQIDFYTVGDLHITKLYHSTKNYYCITNGESWDGVSQSNPSQNHFRLVALAGRKNSPPVTTWFNSSIGKNRRALCTHFGLLNVAKLNFAFKGTLIYEYHCHEFHLDVSLAQGHPYSLSPSNYWWIGGEKVNVDENSYVAYAKMTSVSDPHHSIQIKISNPSNYNRYAFKIEVI